jgi:predicted amidophosphoribosyltransferase
MDQQACPACKAENDADAAYCDQCGQHLAPADPASAADEGACPACGGVVESRGGGKGVCAGCGLELVETPEEPAPKAGPDVAERLTAAILRRAAAGRTVEAAVAEACREVLSAPEDGAPPASASPEEAPEAPEPCPLCGFVVAAGAPRCAGCGLWLVEPRAPQPCPRCDRAVRGGKCECGAILTLAALTRYLDSSVRCVCARCKQPYAVSREKCPECGGALLSADRLKAYSEIIESGRG